MVICNGAITELGELFAKKTLGGKPFLKKSVRAAQAKNPPNPLSKKL